MTDKKTTEITIIKGQSGQRADAFFAELMGFSRSEVAKYGQFTCNNKSVPAKTKTKVDQRWTFKLQKDSAQPKDLQPWDGNIKIIADTPNWAVLLKPEGVSTHYSESEKSHQTIANFCLHQFGADNLAPDPFRPGIVHRLDKPTSGLLLIAKNAETRKFFQENWSDFEKHYQAIAIGKIPKKSRIKGGIIRDPDNRTRMTVTDIPGAKPAETRIECVDFHPTKNQSLLDIQIMTGRTHQIRAHLSAIKHPLLGDNRYGGAKADRLYLHAYKLKFKSPDGEWHTFEEKINFNLD